MPNPGFAEHFISMYTLGQQVKQQKAESERYARQAQYEQEDRDTEKQLLQHRVRELKLQDLLTQRAAARERGADIQGTPTKDLTPDMTEGGVLPATAIPGMGMEDTLRTQMASIPIPGDQSLGIVPSSIRPQTMEDQLRSLFQQSQIKEATTPYTLSATEGGTSSRFSGTGREIASVSGEPKLVPYVTRDANGQQKTEWITQEERNRRGPAIMNRLPSRVSSASIATADEVLTIAEGIRRGDRPADTSGYKGDDRRKIDYSLLKSGFSITKALNDQKALAAHYVGLNSTGFDNLRTAADSTVLALDELDAAVSTWEQSGWGVMSGARAALARTGGLGAEAKATIEAIDAAMPEVQSGLATIKAGGTAPINAQIERAEKSLTAALSSGKLGTTVASIRKEIQHRVSAIRNLQPILPSGTTAGAGGGGGGGTVTVVSPQGVEGTIPADQLQDALAQGYRQK